MHMYKEGKTVVEPCNEERACSCNAPVQACESVAGWTGRSLGNRCCLPMTSCTGREKQPYFPFTVIHILPTRVSAASRVRIERN